MRRTNRQFWPRTWRGPSSFNWPRLRHIAIVAWCGNIGGALTTLHAADDNRDIRGRIMLDAISVSIYGVVIDIGIELGNYSSVLPAHSLTRVDLGLDASRLLRFQAPDGEINDVRRQFSNSPSVGAMTGAEISLRWRSSIRNSSICSSVRSAVDGSLRIISRGMRLTYAFTN